jgi:hypothetical protein
VVGGDLNARTASNGDAETNAEGRELIHFAEEHMLRIVIIIIISKVNTAYRGPRWGSA